MHNSKLLITVSSIGLAACSLASITSVSGDFTIATPSDVSSSPASPVAALDIFAESTAISPSSAVLLDTVATGPVHSAADLVPGTTTPGQSYDSYFGFSDPVNVALFWNASVTFDKKIVGVEVTVDGLNSGTPFFNNAGVFYGPSFSNLDGLELATFDSFNISADRYTMDISLRSFAPGDRFRIITEGGGSVPEPASMAALAIGIGTLLRRRRTQA